MLNIEDMTAIKLDAASAKLLDGYESDPPHAITHIIGSLLDTLHLVDAGIPKLEDTASAPPLSYVSFLVTQICNLACSYCYRDADGSGGGRQMTEKIACDAVDWLIGQSGNLHNLGINFFGGEPLINFDVIRKVVEYAIQRGNQLDKRFSFHLATNATMLDDAKIRFITEHGISVSVSVDGSRETHNSQRPYRSGKGSYDIVSRHVRNLLKVHPWVSCRAVSLDGTHPLETKNALKDFGFSSVSVVNASPTLFTEDQYIPAERQYAGLIAMYEKEGEDLLRNIRERNVNVLKQLVSKDFLWGVLFAIINRYKLHFACEAGRSIAAISPDGGIYLCHRFAGKKDYQLGHINDFGLDRDAYQHSPLKVVDKCSSCFAKYLCGGGCKHDNVGMTGSIFDPPADNCRLTQRVVEIAVVVAAELTPADITFLRAEGIVPRRHCPLDL